MCYLWWGKRKFSVDLVDTRLP